MQVAIEVLVLTHFPLPPLQMWRMKANQACMAALKAHQAGYVQRGFEVEGVGKPIGGTQAAGGELPNMPMMLLGWRFTSFGQAWMQSLQE